MHLASGWFQTITLDNGTEINEGMFVDLAKARATFGSAALLEEDTYNSADYLFHAYTYARFIVRKPAPLPPYLNLIKPLGPLTWLTACITFLTVPLIFVLFMMWHDPKRDKFADLLIVVMCQFSQGNYNIH